MEYESALKKYENQQEEIRKQKSFIDKFRANANKAASVQSRIKLLQNMERVQKLKDYRVLFSDTAVSTTHFLKKCIKVRKFDYDEHDDEDSEELE